MATFEVKVVRIDSAEAHPNAEKLTLNRVGGYTAITNTKDGKPNTDESGWRFRAGDLAVYVPENAVIPEATLKQYGYWDAAKGKGFLGGKLGDRVRPVRLRGIYSEGLLFPIHLDHNYYAIDSLVTQDHCLGYAGDAFRPADDIIGRDVADLLGITKYEPPIPTNMAGQCFAMDGLPKYDVEAYEKYNGVIQPGEEVVATEKLHGTFTGFSFFPNLAFMDAPDGVFVYSKGLGARGLSFKHNSENDGNLYIQMFRELFGPPKMDADRRRLRKLWVQAEEASPVHMFGETFGRGVQDLHYGQNRPTFRLFDVYIGEWGRGRFLNFGELEVFADAYQMDMVPVLYRGPFDEAALFAVRDGKDSLSGTNVREGVVVKPVIERWHDELGRVALKMVSPDYKLRKGGGEELS